MSPSGVARHPAAYEWLVYKTCPRCKESKPWAEFPPRTYWPDGSVRNVRTMCHKCDFESRADWRREYRNRPEVKVRQAQFAAAHYKRKKQTARPASEMRNSGMRLPIAPLRAFLERVLSDEDISSVTVSQLTGMSERAIHRLLYVNDETVLQTADRVITKLGGHLYDVYPELREEEAA